MKRCNLRLWCLLKIWPTWKYNARKAWAQERCLLYRGPCWSTKAWQFRRHPSPGVTHSAYSQDFRASPHGEGGLLHTTASLTAQLYKSSLQIKYFHSVWNKVMCVHSFLSTKSAILLTFNSRWSDPRVGIWHSVLCWYMIFSYSHRHKLTKGRGGSMQLLTVFCVGSYLRGPSALRPQLSATSHMAEHSGVPPSQVWPAFPAQLWRTSESAWDGASSHVLHWLYLWLRLLWSCAVTSTSLSLYLLNSQEGSVVTCQPFQMHLQPRNRSVLTACSVQVMGWAWVSSGFGWSPKVT